MEQQILKRIAKVMKERRQALGYTQEEAAEKMGISYSYYVKVENAIQAPSLDKLVIICKTYRLSMDHLLLDGSRLEHQTMDTYLTLDEIQRIDSDHLVKCRDLLDQLIRLSQK